MSHDEVAKILQAVPTSKESLLAQICAHDLWELEKIGEIPSARMVLIHALAEACGDYAVRHNLTKAEEDAARAAVPLLLVRLLDEPGYGEGQTSWVDW